MLLLAFALTVLLGLVTLMGCNRTSELSVQQAREHVALLAKAVRTDVEEVRQGLPKGAEFVKEYLRAEKYEEPAEARDVLDRARNKVQDLRVAKSTFFALTDVRGTVIRSDQEHDALAGKGLFAAFPKLQDALTGKYVETRGNMAEAAGVRGRKDGQWVAAVAARDGAEARGLYVTGWSWSAYAYRLENQLRGAVRSSQQAGEKDPLLYVYVVVEKDVFGAPVSPDVNARAVAEEAFFGKARGAEVATAEREITGRRFGIAFQRTPELGDEVGIAVLRSET
ncbi:MAG TPA: hypothetical protein VIM73_08820 [Polyangiaceae bacterium]